MPAAEPLDLSRPRAVHVVGVGGAGMSAIAEVLVAMGHRVSGSDLRPSSALGRLRSLGVEVSVGHRASNVGPVDFVTVSSAVPPENPEVAAAHGRGIPVLARAVVLSAITRLRRTASIAGTHGKTTTSALLAVTLDAAGFDPSYIVGGQISGRATGARWSGSEWLVVEADESDGTFLELDTEVALVTSVEPDHLERYGDFGGLIGAFGRFLAGGSGATIVCADDPTASRLGAEHGAVTYGFDPAASLHITGFEGGRSGSRFTLRRDGAELGAVVVPVPGRHNALNATGALGVALMAGASFDAATAAIAGFAGVARRFERRGQRAGVTFVDDYAHLPGEVAPALAAAAAGGWGRVVCVFQPHRFSRTEALWADFADAFTDADLLVVTDVYPAGESPRPGVTGRLVADAVRAAHPSARIEWLPERAGMTTFLRRELREGDLCLTLGAGDLTTLADELLAP